MAEGKAPQASLPALLPAAIKVDTWALAWSVGVVSGGGSEGPDPTEMKLATSSGARAGMSWGCGVCGNGRN